MHSNTYQTRSLALAAAITAFSNAKLDHLDFSNPSSVAFVFNTEDEPNLSDFVGAFFGRELRGDIITYFETLKHLKSRLYEERHVE